MPEAGRICIADACGRGGKLVRGMCARCYRRWLDVTPKAERGLPPRFTVQFGDRVAKTHEHGCWLWTGPRDRKGYGRWGKKLAHRHSWQEANGPIPEGMWILHHCDNPPCVNPAHLYPGTVVENVRDAVIRGRICSPPRKTHCPKGHELSGRNRLIVKCGRYEAQRCRECDNERSRKRQAAQRQARGLLKTRLSPAEESRIRELRLQGLSHVKIAKETGRGVSSVERVLKEAGLSARR
ncbi:HNH endonuclease signature motif containing protein [Streptomyces sp. NPDC006863]|uniref:HNH endonuclease signature motif containing protein n=1 Tax=Streptomyces sp. NPDC006863 TaxID=3154779 RepID=UPI003410A820